MMLNIILLYFFFFFFQAEDGIRDAQESRGLGDVYKRQVENLVRAVAPELYPKRINCVSPGTVSTAMQGPDSPEKDARLLAATAANVIPRPGHPDEVAAACMFVIQNEFVTGTTVDVDGGWLSSI
eukprot:TRINITY_DN23796_c0_g1_i4.p2 TRINITY_DN23796_c0_g1~~TRINITY_DN23796_c0_g1_i4.p2  ORF type:complete len:125 (+),score=46.31 TRINITY_DN23796_c0_g1_i4:46-420(+)